MTVRTTDVPVLMARIEAAMSRVRRAGSPRTGGPIYVPAEGDSEFGISKLRNLATVTSEFPSGSDRPVIGGAIRLAKRVVRRGLRWYVAPMMEEQSRFNHGMLDLMEKLRLKQEQVAAEIDRLKAQLEPSGPPTDHR